MSLWGGGGGGGGASMGYARKLYSACMEWMERLCHLKAFTLASINILKPPVLFITVYASVCVCACVCVCVCVCDCVCLRV